MKRLTFAATASSSSVSVPVTLVSTNSCRLCDPTCGLCSVAACRTASTPRIASRTVSRSATEPTIVVCAEGRRSSPIVSTPSSAARTRHSASPRWPELPVTRMRIRLGYTYDGATFKGDPERAVRADRHPVRLAPGRQVDRGDLALVRDMSDLVGAPQAHPHPVGLGGDDGMRLGFGVVERQFLDRRLVGDPADPPREDLREPQ